MSESLTSSGAGELSADHHEQLSEVEAARALATSGSIANAAVGRLRFGGAIKGPVTLTRCRIDQLVIDQFRTEHAVALRHCTVRSLRVSASDLGKDLVIQDSRLSGGSIRRSAVHGDLVITGLRATHKFAVYKTTVHGRVRGWGAVLEDWLDLDEVFVSGNADLRNLSVLGGASIINCRFDKDFLFRGSSVQMKTDFGGTQFAGAVDLSKAKLRDYVYFDGVRFLDTARLVIRNVVSDRLLLRPSQIRNRLRSEIEGDFHIASDEYGLLRRNFQQLHQYDEEDWAALQFKINQRRSRERSWSRPWTKVAQLLDWLVLQLGCGYGTDPGRAVRSAILTIVAFALLYAATPEAIELPGGGGGEDVPSGGDRLLLGLLISVSVFTTGFDIDLLVGTRGLTLILLAFEAVLGIFIWGLFIVSFARKVIR